VNEHRLVNEFGWVVPLGPDVTIAVRPILVLLVIAAVPLFIKYCWCRWLALDTPARWLYPIEVGYMPVTCLACDVFGVPVAASDSFVGRCPTIAILSLIMCFALWYEVLKGMIAAGQLPGGGSIPCRRRPVWQTLKEAILLQAILGLTLPRLQLSTATRLVLLSVLLFGVCSFGRFDLLH